MELLQNKEYNFFNIKKKDGSVGAFILNEPQKKVLKAIQEDLKTKGKTRKIIIKGRQQGISTLIETLLLSYAMSVEAFTGYAMAHDRETANDIFDKIIKFEWQNMNENLKNIYKMKRDNTRQIMFENMNSSSVTVGLSARGGTVDFLHISEAGKMSMNAKLWNEMKEGSLPAAEKAIGIVIESTADGGLGLFYEMVQDSINGKNDYDLIFLCWTESPEYAREAPEDDSWIEDYKAQAKIYGLYADPMTQFGITKNQFYWYYKKVYELKEAVKVQYPFTLDEAFISKATNKFDINIVKNIKTRPPLQTIDGVQIFKMPERGQIYSIGIDPSSGLGSDWTGLSMRKFYPNQKGQHELVAQMKTKTDERTTARIAINLANWFNEQGKVFIACEINGLGRAVQNIIQDNYDESLIYKRYIQDNTKQYDTLVPDFGFQTTSKNRDVIINNFAYAFVDGKLEILTEEEKQEMLSFVYNDDKGRYEALEGANDDCLFSDMICFDSFNYIRQYG
jgi:hypothetical protein